MKRLFVPVFIANEFNQIQMRIFAHHWRLLFPKPNCKALLQRKEVHLKWCDDPEEFLFSAAHEYGHVEDFESGDMLRRIQLFASRIPHVDTSSMTQRRACKLLVSHFHDTSYYDSVLFAEFELETEVAADRIASQALDQRYRGRYLVSARRAFRWYLRKHRKVLGNLPREKKWLIRPALYNFP